MLKPSLIFCHGFGMNWQYWEAMLPYFSDYNIQCLDLGYFSHPQPLIQPQTKIFAIGHSLGWIKLQTLGLNFTACVGLQAFHHFCGNKQSLSVRRTAELQHLQQQFLTNPKACLRQFYQRCGLPNFSRNMQTIDIEQLSLDLQGLTQSFPILAHIPQLIIGSTQDPIVPPELIYDNFDNQSLVDYILLAEGLHNLGFQHQDILVPIIRDFFDAHQ